MSQATAIEWTDISWNPVHGCSKVSPGCAHCYAETLSRRYKQTLKPWTPANAAENVILKPHKLREPLGGGKLWREPKRVFVNSTSDLFHEQVPDGFIAWVFWVMSQCPQHTFQVLTKRPERMRDFTLRWADRADDAEGKHGLPPMARGPEAIRQVHTAGRALLFADMLEQWGEPPDGAAYPTYDWMGGPRWWPEVPGNVWLGVSIENRRYVGRADLLRATPAAVRFISAEPLLGPLVYRAGTNWPSDNDLDLRGIDWLIAGGESGPRHRRCDPEWVRDLRDLCLVEGDAAAHRDGLTRTAFFFKQWGGATPKRNGRELDGRTWDEMPTAVRA